MSARTSHAAPVSGGASAGRVSTTRRSDDTAAARSPYPVSAAAARSTRSGHTPAPAASGEPPAASTTHGALRYTTRRANSELSNTHSRAISACRRTSSCVHRADSSDSTSSSDRQAGSAA
ncbi:hypothetical protein GCM10018963_64750 [Saccharothrix longispora]